MQRSKTAFYSNTSSAIESGVGEPRCQVLARFEGWSQLELFDDLQLNFFEQNNSFRRESFDFLQFPELGIRPMPGR